MDQNQHGEATREVGPPAHTNPPTQTAGPSNPSFYSREQQYVPPQYMYQLQQNQLQQQLDNVWAKQYKEIEETTNFNTHSLPLAKIKKIMKFDEDVRMISAEAPIVFAKACEMFIQDLTTRAWANADNNNRRTLKKMDITSAISKTDVFDFLLDIV
ncbi:nuclear transcription factor Y subunit C-2 [Cajanus cajan]|uniref:Nuclear transcription factor Y subunit C-2 n=1 Tax=Cajanus cajan TaxID=3821 RepID=A0A151RKW1_CAJCA|nr:nuclear transcription factor Y subunit C-2 [Cajanus cajan]KYP43105.1 Nuclear transcription factor Y subunit C-2 [Cajanus cajan]